MIIILNDFAHITFPQIGGRERVLRRFDYTDNPFLISEEDINLFEEAGRLLAKDGRIILNRSGHDHLFITED